MGNGVAGRTTPELRYLETRWASWIPLAPVVELRKEVWPVGDALHAETVRHHLQATGERLEQELGEERQSHLFQGSEEDREPQPLPDGPIPVGLDGGSVRAAPAGRVCSHRGQKRGGVPAGTRGRGAVCQVLRICANLR